MSVRESEFKPSLIPYFNDVVQMIAAGHDPKQAMAAAYANARKSNVIDEEENQVVA